MNKIYYYIAHGRIISAEEFERFCQLKAKVLNEDIDQRECVVGSIKRVTPEFIKQSYIDSGEYKPIGYFEKSPNKREVE